MRGKLIQQPIFLYGPSGSGKSTSGKILAGNLGLPFFDLDEEIEGHHQTSISEIFNAQGEAAFRELEIRELEHLLSQGGGVIALGGGTLTMPGCRALAESTGSILCLHANTSILLTRLQADAAQRPLLTSQNADGEADLNSQLDRLLTRRASHYASFPLQLDTSTLTPAETAWQAQIMLGRFRVQGMGQAYDINVRIGSLDSLGTEMVKRGLRGPVALVSDENIAALYANRVLASLQSTGYTAQIITIPTGEQSKTIETLAIIWKSFLAAGLERGSTVIAMGGGVVSDLTGFAAATYLRGIAWVNLPTSLLAMVDAGIGGKTGTDLPQGKNLIGAFYSPRLVVSDPSVLASLPNAELSSGMAEVVKHGIIADPHLFDMCEKRASEALRPPTLETEFVSRALAVKVNLIQADPYEKGVRAALNLGHTIGHAVEKASNYKLRHGEAVAIGLVAEARLAENLGLADPSLNLAMRILTVLKNLGLPTEIPHNLNRSAIYSAMQLDKKKANGKLLFALPVRIGEVRIGINVDEVYLRALI